jgi:hypothetical protein
MTEPEGQKKQFVTLIYFSVSHMQFASWVNIAKIQAYSYSNFFFAEDIRWCY